jgi:5-methylcytosine-specific restriction protein A
MATRLRTPCTYPGCPLLTTTGRCHRHRIPRSRLPNRAYGPDWPRIRDQVLKEEPICSCGAPTTEVDHIVPLKRGGTNHRVNLRAMCKRCHSAKTAREGRWGYT